MKAHRIAWLGLGLIGGVIALTSACSSAEENTATNSGAGPSTGSNTTSTPPPDCGNSTVEVGEQCDDGNSDEADGCDMTCRLPVCGNGIAQQGEECDDGDTDNNNACSNRCEVVNKNCGNNTLEPNLGEECDDGNDVQNDGCTNTCTLPQCGDGIVQEGEDCDDGNSEQNDMCPSTCQLDGVTTVVTSVSTGAGGDPVQDCDKVAIYSGLAVKGAVKLHPSVWSYQGNIGTAAGNAMCKDIGADHVCTYEEVVLAGQKGELSNGGVANDTSKLNAEIGQGASSTAWLHRLTPVMAVGCPGGTCQPGAGARCNDWTYPTDHIADGEYTKVGTGANGLAFSLDKDPIYTGIASDGHTDKTDGRNCAGKTRAIMCCFPTCKE